MCHYFIIIFVFKMTFNLPAITINYNQYTSTCVYTVTFRCAELGFRYDRRDSGGNNDRIQYYIVIINIVVLLWLIIYFSRTHLLNCCFAAQTSRTTKGSIFLRASSKIRLTVYRIVRVYLSLTKNRPWVTILRFPSLMLNYNSHKRTHEDVMRIVLNVFNRQFFELCED